MASGAARSAARSSTKTPDRAQGLRNRAAGAEARAEAERWRREEAAAQAAEGWRLRREAQDQAAAEVCLQRGASALLVLSLVCQFIGGNNPFRSNSTKIA